MHGPKPVLDLEKSTLNRNPGYDGQGYTTENPITRSLKRRWDAEDAMRDQVERQVKNKFLEEHANQIFASIEGFLARLDKVLHTTGAAIKINPIWENRDAEALRRVVKVNSTEPPRQLSLAFTIQGTSILYRDRSYHFSRDARSLLRAITDEVEQFLSTR